MEVQAQPALGISLGRSVPPEELFWPGQESVIVSLARAAFVILCTDDCHTKYL